MASQETQTPDPAQEQRKKILFGVLVVIMLVVFWVQDPFGFFTSDEDTGSGTVAAKPQVSPKPKGSPTPNRAAGSKDPIVSSELHPELAAFKNTPLDGIGRNIFVYPTPTPPPTPPPAPPPAPDPTPPIQLVGINPAGVIGRTEGQNLTVTGLKFPPDARIFIDGREIQTRLLDESHLQGPLTKEMIRTPGNLGVQVRSASDPQMYSNQLSLNVAEPPAPPYKFIGLIVTKQSTVAVLKSQSEDSVENVKKGETIGKPKRWEIVSINSQRIEILDNQINVMHTIPFTGEGNGQ